MKKRVLFALAVSITLAVWLTGCFCQQAGPPEQPEKVELGERYDGDEILISEDVYTIGKDRIAKLFDKYSQKADETEFVVHEKTAIAIATVVMRELYPDDNYGVIQLPVYYRPAYYKEENCWEVWLHRNALYTNMLSESEPKTDKVMFVYVDVNTGAVRAIIPADEFSIHNPANSD